MLTPLKRNWESEHFFPRPCGGYFEINDPCFYKATLKYSGYAGETIASLIDWELDELRKKDTERSSSSPIRLQVAGSSAMK
jgi:hypothetical protein